MASTSPQPTVWTLRTLLCASGSPGRSAGSWTSGASGASAAASVTTAGSSSYCDAHEARRLLGGILRLGGHRGHRLAVVLRLADGEHRAVLELGPEARHRLGQVGGRHDEVDARHGAARRSASMASDARVGDGQRHELDVQLAGQVDVGDVALPAGDARVAADAVR